MASFLVQPASARRGGPTWESRTEGSPVATLVGHWSESEGGREAALTFVGGHAIGSKTTFKAGWVSPFTSTGEVPEFEVAYQLNNINDLGADIRIVDSFRYRLKGQRWSPWWREKFVLKRGWNGLSVGAGFLSFGKRRAEFEWRLRGVIEAPTELDGSVQTYVN